MRSNACLFSDIFFVCFQACRNGGNFGKSAFVCASKAPLLYLVMHITARTFGDKLASKLLAGRLAGFDMLYFSNDERGE